MSLVKLSISTQHCLRSVKCLELQEVEWKSILNHNFLIYETIFKSKRLQMLYTKVTYSFYTIRKPRFSFSFFCLMENSLFFDSSLFSFVRKFLHSICVVSRSLCFYKMKIILIYWIQRFIIIWCFCYCCFLTLYYFKKTQEGSGGNEEGVGIT